MFFLYKIYKIESTVYFLKSIHVGFMCLWFLSFVFLSFFIFLRQDLTVAGFKWSSCLNSRSAENTGTHHPRLVFLLVCFLVSLKTMWDYSEHSSSSWIIYQLATLYVKILKNCYCVYVCGGGGELRTWMDYYKELLTWKISEPNVVRHHSWNKWMVKVL